MMLRYSFDQDQAADLLDEAIAKVLASGLVELMEAAKPGANVRRRGEDVVEGALLFPAGRELPLRLVDQRAFDSGAVYLAYERR